MIILLYRGKHCSTNLCLFLVGPVCQGHTFAPSRPGVGHGREWFAIDCECIENTDPKIKLIGANKFLDEEGCYEWCERAFGGCS